MQAPTPAEQADWTGLIKGWVRTVFDVETWTRVINHVLFAALAFALAFPFLRALHAQGTASAEVLAVARVSLCGYGALLLGAAGYTAGSLIRRRRF